MPTQQDAKTRILTELKNAIAYYRGQTPAGIDLAGLWQLTLKAVASFIEIVDSLASAATGPEKKRVVMAAAAEFYDKVLGPLNIPRLPDLIETNIVDPALRALWLSFVDGAIEALLKILQNGATTMKPPPSPPPSPPSPPLPEPDGWTPY